MTAQTDYWFKPKTYGYGATPSNWKGWAATAVFVLAIWGFAAWYTLARGALSSTADFAIWFGGIAAITLPFVWLCRVKTDGGWRWQWGKSDNA